MRKLRHSTFTPDWVERGQPLLFLPHLRFSYLTISKLKDQSFSLQQSDRYKTESYTIRKRLKFSDKVGQEVEGVNTSDGRNKIQIHLERAPKKSETNRKRVKEKLPKRT